MISVLSMLSLSCPECGCRNFHTSLDFRWVDEPDRHLETADLLECKYCGEQYWLDELSRQQEAMSQCKQS